MRVSEAMTHNVRIARPEQSIAEAARVMMQIDAGALPVGEHDKLVGMITDRDIAIRAVALGKGPGTLVRDVMSIEVKYCFEDEDIEDVARNMAVEQIRRLPVVNRAKRLVGILSLGDLALKDGGRPSGITLARISQPGGEHSQSADDPTMSSGIRKRVPMSGSPR